MKYAKKITQIKDKMRENVSEYFKILKGMLDNVVTTDADGKTYQLNEAIDLSIRMIINRSASGGKLLFIGNGGSAAIASHMAVDFWKNAGIRAVAFNDSSLLTCISNDYGYEHVFEKPIEMFAEPADTLIAISSSGQSENILRGVSAAKKRSLKVLTLSGFNKDNPLRELGDINFYVPSESYGHVEIVHLSICHCLVETIIIIEKKNG